MPEIGASTLMQVATKAPANKGVNRAHFGLFDTRRTTDIKIAEMSISAERRWQFLRRQAR